MYFYSYLIYFVKQINGVCKTLPNDCCNCVVVWCFRWLCLDVMSWFSTSYKYHNVLRRNRGGPYRTEPATDLSRWRLRCVEGAQRWYYIPEGSEPEREQSLLEKHSLGIDCVSTAVVTADCWVTSCCCYWRHETNDACITCGLIQLLWHQTVSSSSTYEVVLNIYWLWLLYWLLTIELSHDVQQNQLLCPHYTTYTL